MLTAALGICTCALGVWNFYVVHVCFVILFKLIWGYLSNNIDNFYETRNECKNERMECNREKSTEEVRLLARVGRRMQNSYDR